MDEEKYQKELFEFEKPKRFFPKLSDFFPKADFERNVVLMLTLDRAVFISIGIIMVMVVVYALGVESGKTRIIATPQPAKSIQAQAIKQNPPIQVPAPVTQNSKTISQGAAPPKAQLAAPLYTIVAATFSRKDIAMQEVAKLKRQGYNAALIQSDRYFQACVGAYADKTSAQSQKDLKKLKFLYKDAYFKSR